MHYRGLMGLMMDYGLSWTIVDYCGTLWTIVDYHGFLICTTMELHGLQDIHPKPMTTLKGYGAHHSLHQSCVIMVLSWIIDYHGLSWIIVDYLGLWLIRMDYGLWWINMDYGLSCIMVD